MPSLAVVKASNAKFAPKSTPVAIFVGGTSGIGEAIAKAFACYTNGNAHIILCGRNRTAAESIIASFPKPSASSISAGAKHEFVQCDATLMKNVQETTTGLLSRLTKVNYLVLSPGIMTMQGRTETEEGIDRKLALHYYARWKFTYDLLPLLRKARDAGEDAKVMSILGAGASTAKVDLDDIPLKKHYSLAAAASHTIGANDLMIESFAEREPGIAFTHIRPGAVRTPLLHMGGNSWAMRPVHALLDVLVIPFSVSPAECAEYMLWALFNGKQGAYRRDDKGEDIGKTNYFGSEEAKTRVWEHTEQEVKRAVESNA